MNEFLTNTYKKVSWVTIIDSKKDWKNIWIFALTHGNEPVWMDVFFSLMNDFKIQERLLSGKIFLITINRQAYQKYIAQDNFLEHRFIHHNMNRIYKKDFVSWSYEFERFQELKSIFDEIDMVIDLHSVSAWDDVIGITDKKYLDIWKQIFDVENILVDDVVASGALIWYFIERWKIAFWLECGNHIGKDAYKNGLRNVLNFLSFFGSIDEKIIKSKLLHWVFEFIQEVFPESLDFHYVQKYLNFTKLEIWEVFALDREKEYKNILWKDIYIGLPGKSIKLWDGNGFLFKKID